MDQLLNLGLQHIPNIEEARKVMERYVPSKLAIVHASLVATVVSNSDYGMVFALLLLLWIMVLSAASGATILLKNWPTRNGEQITTTEFLDQLKAREDASIFLAVRAAVSSGAFFGFAYLLREPFAMLGLYSPLPALALFCAVTALAGRLGYTDRLREAAEKDAANPPLSVFEQKLFEPTTSLKQE